MSLYAYIFAMAVTTYLIRMLPLTVFRKPIKSRFVKSFLHYVPYACLTAMTFPAVLFAAGNVAAAAVGFAVAILFALWGKGLTTVAVAASAAVYLTDWIMILI